MENSTKSLCFIDCLSPGYLQYVIFLIVLIFGVVINGWAQTATPPAVGDGSLGNPYKITTLDNLYWISQTPAVWGAYFYQMNNIDASATSGWDSNQGFSPIGSAATPFTGNYNGRKYAISGLTINRPGQDNVGMFGVASAGGHVQQLALTNVDITGNNYVGGIVGQNDSATVYFCHTSGQVAGQYGFVGGLVGSNGHRIDLSSSSCDVLGAINIGGLVGQNSGEVTESYSSGYVDAVDSEAEILGGLTGTNLGSISGSYSTAQVGYPYNGNILNVLGGLVGYNKAEGTPGTIEDSYAACTMSSGEISGGLVGNNDDTFPGIITNSYWLNTDSNSDGGEILTPEEMRSQSSYTNWDFSATWDMIETITFPYLKENLHYPLPGSENAIDGTGTEVDPYLISEFEHLVWMSADTSGWHGYYRQVGDINASISYTPGYTFTPIGGSPEFQGTYDGNGYIIDSLSVIIDQFATGLFGTAANAVLKNIALTNVNIQGSGFGGALVGVSFSSNIQNCYSTGSVYTQMAGGLVGGIIGMGLPSTIANCYSTCSVGVSDGPPSMTAGGLASIADGVAVITNSYSTGVVQGSGAYGGLIGSIDNPLVTITNCTWNMETSKVVMGYGQSANEGIVITGLSTAQMKQQASFNGWDFITIWDMEEYLSFPYLKNIGHHRSAGPFINSGPNWYMFGSPFCNSTYGCLLDSLWTQGFPGSDAPDDAINVYTWDEAISDWVAPDALTEAMAPGQGSIIYVFEDDQPATPEVEGSFPKSYLLHDAEVNATAITIPLSYEGIGDFAGFNLVSNPLLETIEWDVINKTNVGPTYYYWNPDSLQYEVYQQGGGGDTNWGSPDIDPFQGFWVQATGAGASLTIVPEPDNPEPLKIQAIEEQPLASVLLQLSSSDGHRDQFRLVLRPEAANGYDGWDAMKLQPLADSWVSLSSRIDEKSLAIDSRPLNNAGAVKIIAKLEMVSNNTADGAIHHLSLKEDDLPGWDIALVNTTTGQRYDLRTQRLTVEPTINKAKTTATAGPPTPVLIASSETNWQLVLSGTPTTLDDPHHQIPQKLALQQNYPNPFNPSTEIRFDLPTTGKVRLVVYNIMGREISQLIDDVKEAGRYTVRFDASKLASGTYLYSLQTPNGNLHRMMTLIK